MIFDSNSSSPLLADFRAAQEAEGVAIHALRVAQQSGADRAMLRDLTNQMTDAHDNKMRIWNQLEKHRLDN